MSGTATDEVYDLAILGGGPGGYAAALRAGALNLKVAMIETKRLGGLCLNEGCIPSKALLHVADILEETRKAERLGIKAGDLSLDWPQVQRRKQEVVDRLRGGLETLLRDRAITIFEGKGRPAGSGVISVRMADGHRERVTAKNIILATGSQVEPPVGVSIDDRTVVDAGGALALSEVPKKLVVLGGDWWGVELASMYASFGSQVVLVEAGKQLVAEADAEIARMLARSLSDRGIRVLLESVLEGLVVEDGGRAAVRIRSGRGEPEEILADKVILAVGRVPRTEDLGILRLKMKNQFIQVDERMLTSVEGVYAVGDIVPTPALAHVAFAEGIVAAEAAAGKTVTPVNYDSVARLAYSRPQVVSVGLSEEEARRRGIEIEVGRYSLGGNSQALIAGESRGLVKLVSEPGGRLLGVHVIGPQATELVSEALVAVNWEASAEDLGQLIHPHPTFSEAIGEAAMALLGKPLHAPVKRRGRAA